MRIVIDILVAISVFFAFAGTVGILRFPDTFTRIHASGNITTLGVLGVIIGGVLYSGFYLHDGGMVVKLIIMGVFYLVTSPISSHAIMKGAYKHGVRPEKEMVWDKYGEDMVGEEEE